MVAKAGPDDALAAALAHQRRGEPARAEALCREIVRSAPDHPGALGLLGLLLCRRGDFGPAIDLYRRAVAHAPEEPTLRVHLGKALSEAGREEEAAASYRAALALDPARADAHADLGVLRQRAGDLPGALASYREALRLGASTPLVYHNLATALRGEGHLAEAIAHAERAAARLPHALAPRVLLAEMRLENGDVEGALEECRICLRHEARNRHAIALEALAVARLGGDQSGRGLPDLNRLVRLRDLEVPPPYPQRAAFDAALARAFAALLETPCRPPGAGPCGARRSGEALRGSGGAPGALAARYADAAQWYLDRRPRDSAHPFLRWRPRDSHVEGDVLDLPGGARSGPGIRERGWVSGLYAVAPAPGGAPAPRVELGVPPPRLGGGQRFEGRDIALEAGRLVLFPSCLFHSLRAPAGTPRQLVVTFDLVPD